MLNKQPKWIPVIKEDFDSSTIEYSIAREGTHGVISWGWASPTKKIILFTKIERPSDLPRLKQICIEFANLMNKREGNE